jgi:hypothetical protein
MALKNNKIFAITGIILAVVAVIAVAVVVFTSDNSDTGNTTSDNGVDTANTGSLSGRYKAVDIDMYIEFSGENTIKMTAAGGISTQGTYTLNGNRLDYEWTVTYSNQITQDILDTKEETGYVTLSDDKQEIMVGGMKFVKL